MAKLRGELIERSLCLRQAAHIMTSLRQRLMLVPTLAARRLAVPDDAKHAAKEAIAVEVRAALEELSTFPEKVTEADRWERVRK